MEFDLSNGFYDHTFMLNAPYSKSSEISLHLNHTDTKRNRDHGMIDMWLFIFRQTMHRSYRINDVYAIDGAMVSRISILNWIHLTASVIVNTKTTPLRFDRSNRKQLLFEVSVNSYKNTTDNLSIKTKGVFFLCDGKLNAMCFSLVF